jgi:nucleoside-diphosphate-sugar epimerase
MNVLVTGNLGYIGSILVPELVKKNYNVTGLDIGFFKDCLISDYKKPHKQIIKDIRKITTKDLDGFEAIIHLAALSNDPLGDLSPGLTEIINFESTFNLANLAKKVGVKKFIFSSSLSMYGFSDIDEEMDEDQSKKNPITAYAKTKWQAECKIKELNDDNFCVTFFRPATVFGASPRLRCDIVFNNFIACAYTTGKIEIKSDGSPWRPAVHIKDVCKAYIAGLEAPEYLISGKAFNVGYEGGNYTVRELAQTAQSIVPGCELIFTNEHSDPRTYKISFSRISNVLKDYYKPTWTLERGGEELIETFKSSGFNENIFRGNIFNRLLYLEGLIHNNILTKDLYVNEK